MQRLLKQFFACSAIFYLLTACGGSGPAARKDDFSSPKNLYVDYISSFTGGVISRTSSIRIRLAKSAGDSLAGKAVEDSFFKFSPSMKGTALWEDNRTIVYTPSEYLPSNTKYEAVFSLGKVLKDVPGDRSEFKFTFQTLIQNFDGIVNNLQPYDKKDLKRMRIDGQVQTADFADIENVEKVLKATQGGKDLKITWKHGDNNTHSFVVEEVVRSEKESAVTLAFNGASIGAEKSEEQEVKVPSLSDFSVQSSKFVTGAEDYISILFSDPLDDKQALQGLIQLAGNSNRHRTVISLNELKIYPTSTLQGSVEVTVHSSLKNIAGYNLKQDYSTSLEMVQVKPEIRLVDDSGKSILPSTNGVILPFEAVGLSAVDVTVTRVFEDNMLQYLQTNNMGGRYELRRVGRPVTQTVIQLNNSGVTNLNKWNRFTLNLEEIIKTAPGAVYEIKIGFRKKYSLYFCTAEGGAIEEMDDIEEDWGAEEEESYWDGYEDYYNDDYRYEDRDNPCTSSYYGDRRSIRKVLFSSDLGLIAKKRDDGNLHVFATNLVNVQPMSGVDVKAYDYQQQLLSSGQTDGDGKVILQGKGNPFVIIAKKDNQVGYLKIDDGSSLSLSNFDVTGERIQNGLKGFIYGERGVWRPADTLHLGFILEDIEETLPSAHPVIMELWNPMGQLYSRKVSSQPVGDMYRFDLLTDKDAPTGNWLAKAKVGGATFSKQIKIETIKPNRLKIELNFNKSVFTSSDQQASGDLNVRWLSGAKAGNLKAEFELVLSPIKTTFKKYPNYSFDDLSKDFYSEREMVYEGRVNAEGYSRININLGEPNNAPGALNARFLGKVYEEGGDFSISNVSMPYYPYSTFVGVKTPEGDKRGIILTDKDHAIRIASVDADGNPINRRNVKVQLFKLDWKWWWDNSYDAISNYVGRSYRDPIKEGFIDTNNGEGSWNLRIDYPQWGRYFVRVEDPISGHSAGQVVYIDWPGWAGKGKRGELGGSSMLDFGIEKEEYKVGEKIALSIPSTAGNRILVSLESGSKVLQTFWVEAKEGNTAIDFEATSDMAPNFYVSLTMLQPHGQTSNDLPIRLYGVQSVKVVDPGTRLEPVIAMPDDLRPEQSFTIGVSEKGGKAMAYSIAVVDEGLLDITNFKTPDPWNSFYAREALGIKTWDVYDDVMGAFAGKIERLLAVGGDGEIEAKEETEANRFKPVVMYLGPFYLEAGKSAKHNLKLPQYIGSVKTMVIAANNGAYGFADKATPVKQPLMILATLPRVAGPTETMKLPVNVFALDNNVKNAKIKVEATGTLALDGAAEQSVTFTGQGDKVIYFDLKAKEVLGVGKVKVTATSGSLTASYDIEMNIIPRNPPVTQVVERVLGASENWSLDYTPIGLAGRNEGAIELSTLPPLNIEQRLGYLIQYPHGCIEQTTSSVFAQLYLDNLTTLPDDKKMQIQKNIDAAINRLKSFQLSSGGFSYWPGNSYANFWGTNYAGHFLVEARKKGYSVPEGMLASWINFQTQKADAWGSLSGEDDNDLIQAYRLYTLALAGSPAVGAMNRMKEKVNLQREARWRLALTYALAGFDQQATGLVEGLSSDVEPDNNRRYYYTYGSPMRDQAMIMETLLQLKRKEDAFGILQKIAKEMGDKDKWMSTQTTAYCFISIAKYVQDFPLDESLTVALEVGGKLSPAGGKDYVTQVYLQTPDKQQPIKITNNGSAPIFARVIRKGVPIEGGEIAGEKNLSMIVSYKTMDGDGLDVSRLKQGTNFMAEVVVRNPGEKGLYKDMALTQLFPSGWEIINTRLEGTEDASNGQKPDYTDIRDDRVMNYFDLQASKQIVIRVLLNASYQGKFYMPATSVEAMYDDTIYAHKAGRWVEVITDK
ncbi:MAG: alpha-2-macroglobulin family protein [Imperialibacter sp.]|uniref:alpha-2-macroglobulin family protein n=1 Tax=Imperialibacter sp. TaxID=2038411 RepID=UPI0032EC6DE3